jgi:hypothetical protein
MAATWFCGLLLLFDDVKSTGITALADPRLWGGTVIGGAIAVAWSPIFQARWNRWYLGAILGMPMCACILTGFFFVFPHSWQPTRLEAWKSTATILHVYADILIPVCAIAGASGTWLVGRARTATRATR